MEITLLTLRNMLADAAEIGAQTALTKAGLIKPWISKAEAFRRYGEKTVKRWIAEGQVKLRYPSINAVKKHINLEEIEAVNKAYNTPIYKHF
ncbi:hypothetical protein [Pedobacter glucosidilyticus]|uniref:hypothetical protein n=1 Tax=Pedobacter glucosidilyticus TaxID=1122941 RepID=UPI0003FCB343|nr:hypothetical protein [Pedobacter glucosidilyticus]